MSYWGVDTCTPASSSLLSTIKSDTGGKPSFWGRYLTNNSVCPSGALTNSEVSFLHSNGIKIALIVNNWNLSDLSTYSQGQSAAQHCISAAESNVNGVSVPKGAGYVIFLDIETNNPSYSWFEGFGDEFANQGNPYFGGIYGNPADFGSNYCIAAWGSSEMGISADANVRALSLWSNEPEPGFSGASNPPSWNPDSPGCTANTVAWQYYEGSTFDEDEASSLGDFW